MPTDPICGMTVEEGPSSLRLERDNRTYYFCSSECRRSFAAPEETRRRLLHRLAVAWPLSVGVALLAWLPHLPAAGLAAAVAAGVVQAYPGSVFYEGARDAIRQRVGNMDLLIAVGTTAAFAYSVAVLAAPGRLPPATYFDASSLIVTVILTGNYLEQLTRRRAGSALRQLADLLPRTAEVVEGSSVRTVALEELRPGQHVRVPPGSRFPGDGVVLRGVSAVDESLLTGEGATVRRGPGDRVLAGAQNVEGPLVVELSATGPDTFVAHIGHLLEEAELGRVPLQQRADRLAARFVPFVLALAVAAGVLWFLLTRGDLPVAVLVFVTVSVTACPCAFGLATPAALLVGTGRAAEEGILFRGGDAIERTASVDTVMFDKTGTLTSPEPEVARVLAVPPLSEGEIVGIAAGLEQGIHHPLARALEQEARRRGTRPVELLQSELEPGRGVLGLSAEHRLALVRGDAVGAEGIADPPFGEWVRQAAAHGATWSLVTRDGAAIGAVEFRSPVLPDAAGAVAALRAEGIRIALVTGDNERAARAVGERVGIAEVHAGVAPDEKVRLVQEARDEGRRVAFVGDGVNDAPALATADAGIAVGVGTEVAREAGRVLLVRPGLAGVPAALTAARAIVRRVRANLRWAIGYNAVLLPIAAGALVPWLGLGVYRYLPELGAVAMALSSTTVLVNSLALRRTIRPARVGGGPSGDPRSGPSRPEAV